MRYVWGASQLLLVFCLGQVYVDAGAGSGRTLVAACAQVRAWLPLVRHGIRVFVPYTFMYCCRLVLCYMGPARAGDSVFSWWCNSLGWGDLNASIHPHTRRCYYCPRTEQQSCLPGLVRVCERVNVMLVRCLEVLCGGRQWRGVMNMLLAPGFV